MNQEKHIDGDALAKALTFLKHPELYLGGVITKVAAESGAFTDTQITVLKGVIAQGIKEFKEQKIEMEEIVNNDYIENKLFKKSA